ncbi:MAG: hypothetical protein KFKLKKLM_01142 [Flavobacteriales bacterium]|nr:hypothetical protein [Flavobacteriales bacterium]
MLLQELVSENVYQTKDKYEMMRFLSFRAKFLVLLKTVLKNAVETAKQQQLSGANSRIP